MQLKINEMDLLILKDINDPIINKYLSKILNLTEEETLDFMEYLYDKANEYLNGKNYSETPKSKTLEKVDDYIFDITK